MTAISNKQQATMTASNTISSNDATACVATSQQNNKKKQRKGRRVRFNKTRPAVCYVPPKADRVARAARVHEGSYAALVDMISDNKDLHRRCRKEHGQKLGRWEYAKLQQEEIECKYRGQQKTDVYLHHIHSTV